MEKDTEYYIIAKRGSKQKETLLDKSNYKLQTQDSQTKIYILYIDFKNAFGSIDHARLLAIMKDLGYPPDSINLLENI